MDMRWSRPGAMGPAVAAVIVLLTGAGCGAMRGGYEKDSGTDTTTLAEMRMNEAGGPSPAARPAGLANPVTREDAPPLSDRALTDAGPNTPLGKQWIFT